MWYPFLKGIIEISLFIFLLKNQKFIKNFKINYILPPATYQQNKLWLELMQPTRHLMLL